MNTPVFSNSPCRETPKNALNKIRGEKMSMRSLEWSKPLRNSRADSRTIYQHGADVNVLFERRVAMANT
jgi:hypothetical protein